MKFADEYKNAYRSSKAYFQGSIHSLSGALLEGCCVLGLVLEFTQSLKNDWQAP